MQIRKEMLVNGSYYHIFSRSISKFVIFNNNENNEEYLRILEILKFYRFSNFSHKYSRFIDLDLSYRQEIYEKLIEDNKVLVEIIAYCLMPTHFHLILKQLSNKGISKYLSRVLNSYARFFNTKHHRNGPLWSGRFKSVLVSNNDQLLHLTRYFHLNPTSAGLVKNPDEWPYSSYREYLGKEKDGLCKFSDLFNLDSEQYQKFINERKNYQRELSRIKNLIIDGYTG